MKKCLIGNVPSNKVSVILRPSNIDSDGKRTKAPKVWRQAFMLFVGVTIFLIIMIIIGLLFPSETEWERWLGLLIMYLLVDAWFIFIYMKAYVLTPRKFTDAINKFGRDNIISQLIDSNAEAFYIEEDLYDSLTILTDDFIVSANDFIYALSDIKMISLYEHQFSEKHINGTADVYHREVLKNVYTAIITMNDGSHKKELIAIKRSDIKMFINALRRRSPEATFRCPDLQDPDYA